MGYKYAEAYQPPAVDGDGVEWSQWEDHGQTAAEALNASPYRETFRRALARFASKANSHERVEVSWWYAPYVYLGVRDVRMHYPCSGRALVSFDLTNGGFGGNGNSANYYVFARRGWRTFIAGIVGWHESYVRLYSSCADPEGRACWKAKPAA